MHLRSSSPKGQEARPDRITWGLTSAGKILLSVSFCFSISVLSLLASVNLVHKCQILFMQARQAMLLNFNSGQKLGIGIFTTFGICQITLQIQPKYYMNLPDNISFYCRSAGLKNEYTKSSGQNYCQVLKPVGFLWSQINNFRPALFSGRKINVFFFLIIAEHYIDLNEGVNQQCDGYLILNLINCLLAQISNEE